MTIPIDLQGAYARAKALAESPPSSSTIAGRNSIDALETRIDRQNLVIQTLLILLLEKKVFDEAEFRKWRDYADNLDGRADGRLKESTLPQSCPKCQRNNPSSAVKCQYCGEAFEAPVADARHKKS